MDFQYQENFYLKKERQKFLTALWHEPNQTSRKLGAGGVSPSNYERGKKNSLLEVYFRKDLKYSKSMQKVYCLESIFE